MRIKRLLTASLLAANLAQTVPISLAANSPWAPNVASGALPAPNPGNLLMVAGGRNSWRYDANVGKIILSFESRGQMIYDWDKNSSTPLVEMLDEITLVGDAAQADRALKTIIKKNIENNYSGRTFIVRMPMDALYLNGIALSAFEEMEKSYDMVVAQWAQDPHFLGGKKLQLEMATRGKPRSKISIGKGERTVTVQIDITDLKALMPDAEKLSIPQDSKNGPRWPGSWLDSRSAPRIRFDGGDRNIEGIQGTLIKNDTLGPGSIDVAARLARFGDTGGGGEIRLIHDKSYGQTFDRFDVNWMLTENETVNHGVSFRYQMNENPIENHRLFRGAYINRLDYGGFRNEARIKVGHLTSQNRYGGTEFEPETQMLYGADNTVSYRAYLGRMLLTAEGGVSAAIAEMQHKREFDHGMVHGGLQAEVPLPQNFKATANYQHRTTKYNTDRYFFLDRQRDDQILGALAWAHGGFNAAVLGGVTVIKGSNMDDVQKKAGVQIGFFNTALTALASQGQVMKQQTFAISQSFANKLNVEVFMNTQSPTNGSYKIPNKFGLAAHWGFGGPKKGGLPDEGRYRRELQRNEQFFQDHKISQEQLAQAMDSVEKINKFVGSNVSWITGSADKWSRTPKETYIGRGGDCDEQAWLISKVLNDNPVFRRRGGKASIFVYWVGGKGHAASFVEENGKIFISQYGLLFRVNVAAGATLEQKAQAALEQVGPYLALSPRDGQSVDYGIWGTDVVPPNGDYWGYYNDQKTASLVLSKFKMTATRPQTETGANAKIGDGFDN